MGFHEGSIFLNPREGLRHPRPVCPGLNSHVTNLDNRNNSKGFVLMYLDPHGRLVLDHSIFHLMSKRHFVFDAETQATPICIAVSIIHFEYPIKNVLNTEKSNQPLYSFVEFDHLSLILTYKIGFKVVKDDASVRQDKSHLSIVCRIWCLVPLAHKTQWLYNWIRRKQNWFGSDQKPVWRRLFILIWTCILELTS